MVESGRFVHESISRGARICGETGSNIGRNLEKGAQQMGRGVEFVGAAGEKALHGVQKGSELAQNAMSQVEGAARRAIPPKIATLGALAGDVADGARKAVHVVDAGLDRVIDAVDPRREPTVRFEDNFGMVTEAVESRQSIKDIVFNGSAGRALLRETRDTAERVRHNASEAVSHATERAR